MPELGGLHDMTDVKGLILYLLKEARCILKEAQMTEVLMADGLVEYFDYTQAMEQLLIAGMIDIASLEETNSFRITKRGLAVEAEYEARIPYNVRSKTLAALKENLRKRREEEQIFTEISPSQSGYRVTCSISEGGETMLAYEALVPDHRSAYLVAERFRENPSHYYQKMMEIILEDDLFKKTR